MGELQQIDHVPGLRKERFERVHSKLSALGYVI